ncbi:hypothetical protein LTR66_010117 [Elasticomyces elasticus]|nr:hypothetical protein LTR66_010117 [Elasticomyces elasticus]
MERNVGYVTCDNHRVNDTMCKAISEALGSMDPPTERNPLEHQIRYDGHVINPTIQAFLFARDKDAVSVAIEASQSSLGRVDVDDALANLQSDSTAVWAQVEPLNKLHRHTRYFLLPFYEVTKATEGDKVTFDDLLFSMDSLVTHYKAAFESRELIEAVTTSWFLFDKYYKGSNESAAYAAAILLHPTLRLQYVKEKSEEAEVLTSNQACHLAL